jgi:flavin-dependent dehydrogenase
MPRHFRARAHGYLAQKYSLKYVKKGESLKNINSCLMNIKPTKEKCMINTSGFTTVDTVIMGGGLAGLTLAIQLKKKLPDLTIAVIEQSQFPVPAASHKVGEATVELATHYFSEILGITEHLESSQLPKLGLRYFFSVDTSNVSSMDNFIEFGTKTFPPTPSFQLDRGILENHLFEVCVELGIEVYQNTRVRTAEVGKGDVQHEVSVVNRETKEKIEFKCTWLVDALSRAFLLKRKLDMRKDHAHKANSAWFRIGEKINVNDWNDSPQWHKDHKEENSRWYSTNHFMGEGYWIWIIPLVSGSTSIGIVAEDKYHPLSDYNSIEKAMTWLWQHQPKCASHIEPHLEKLQDFKSIRNFTHSAVLYEDKYRLFGKPTIMIVKYIWDTALYWGLNCFLFTQGKFEKTDELQRYYISVSDLNELNQNMQQLLIDWSEYEQDKCVASYINVSNHRFDFFIDMNRVLLKPHTDEEFAAQLGENAQKMRTLYADIVDYVGKKEPELANKYPNPTQAQSEGESPIVYMMQQIRGEIDIEMADSEMVEVKPEPELA